MLQYSRNVKFNKKTGDNIMKVTILIFIFTASIFATENPKILQKQIEKQLSIQGDADGATQKCLAELENKSLTKEQKKKLQNLLKRSALQSKDLNVAREAEAYLINQKINCDKLTQKLSLGLSENFNTNLNKNIREALEYQWKTINWKKPGTDLEVLNKYLMEIAVNSNVSQNARVQAVILVIQINNFHKNKLSEELYDKLKIDLQCPLEKEAEIRIKKCFNRLYETARHYLTENHALSIGTILNLLDASEEIPKKYKLEDIFKIHIYRFNKQIELLFDKYKEMEIEEIEKFSDDQINELKNKIIKLEKPLNEIRKYVYENYEKQRIIKQQQLLKKEKIANEFLKELKVFIEEGPKENKEAIESRDNLLKLLSKNPDLVSPELVDFLKNYPELTEKYLIALWKTTKIKNRDQWYALMFYNEIQDFQKTISTMKNPELIKQFLNSFIRKLYGSGIQQFSGNDYLAFNATYRYIKGLAHKNISMTNFVPLLAYELERIAEGHSMLENYSEKNK